MVRVATVSTDVPTLPAVWRGLVDDAAIFPPGDAPIHDAAAAHQAVQDGAVGKVLIDI